MFSHECKGPMAVMSYKYLKDRKHEAGVEGAKKGDG